MDITEKRRQEARKVMGGILGNNTSVMQKPVSEQEKRRLEARSIIENTLKRNTTVPTAPTTTPVSSIDSPYAKYTNAKDFKEYAQRGAAIQNPNYKEATTWLPFQKKIKNKVTFANDNTMIERVQNSDPKHARMTQEEVDVYNYLLAKSGNMKGGDFLAEEFLKSIDSELNKRTMQDWSNAAKEVAAENKVAGVVLNLGASMLQGAGALKTVAQSASNQITGKSEALDPNDPVFTLTAMEQASREGIKDEMGSVGSFLTDTGLSMGQTLIRLPMGVAGLPLAGLGAASQTSRDVLERGGSQNQAMLVGSLAGAAEIVFEKISLDNLKAFKHNPAKNGKDLIKNILKGAGVEGTEEVLTEITNGIFDRVLMKDLSQHELRIASYKAQGITDQKAKQMANMEFAKEIGLSFLGGALSGGVMGTGANVLGNYQQGKMVQDTNSTQALIDEGLASEPNTTAYKNAVANQEMLNKGKKVSNTELGYQINANQEAINQEEMNTQNRSNETVEVPTMQQQSQVSQNPQITRLQGESESYNQEGKSAFLNGYDGRLDIDTYKKGFDRFYNNGKTNLSLEWTEQQSAFTPLLSPETRKNAWLSGQKYAQDIATEQHAKLVPIKEKGGFDNIDNMSLLDDAEASVIHYIANATGVKVVAHEDIEGMNGYYENGTIHISSKADNKPLVVFSHELTHHLEDTSPTAWKDYKDYVINYMKTDHAEKFNSLYSHTENLYREHGLDITDDLITNEIVANATEEFLTDGKSIERLIQQDRNLAQKIFDAIERFIEVIKESFTGYSANTREGKLMRENLEVLEQSRKLWFDALEKSQAVSQIKGEVKHSLKGKNEDVYTDNFKNWFGDWENDSKGSSKVVNDNGTPKVMYAGHGNVTLFGSVFDPKKATSGGLYFTDSPDIASNYATGKTGNKEYYENGSEYRFKDTKGNYSKKINNFSLTPNQIELAESFTEAQDGMSLNDYINEYKKYDRDVMQWGLDGGNSKLINFYKYYEYNGNTANSRYVKNSDGTSSYIESGFESLLKEIGIEWTSYDMPNGGVFPVFLDIKNPIITSEGIPSDLMDRLWSEARKEKSKTQAYIDNSHWTSDYPLKAWVDDIDRMYETGDETFWATQIPKKAKQIMQELGYDGIKDVGGKMGGSVHEVWIALDSNQVKSATGNQGTYNSAKKDIRLSLKDTSDVDMKRLTAENEKLKETNAVLKQQFKLTKGYVPKESALRSLANSIKKEYSSAYDTNTLVDNLKGLVEHINNSNTMQWDDVMEATVGMAKKIVESSSTLNNTLYNEYSELREKLRTTSIKLSEDAKTEIAYHYGSYENFRRENFGRLKLTNEGISLDSLWGELSAQYPEVFSADTNDLEQALVVSQFLDSIKPFYENPYGMDMDAVAYDLALDLYKQYFDIPGVITYADRQAMKLREVKNHYEERIQSIRDDYKERYENRLSEIKVKHKDHLSAKNELLDKQRAKHKEVMAKSKATVKEKGLIKKYRARIEKNTKDLSMWLLKPTDTKHVPEKLKRTVTEFLSTLDFSSTRLNNLGEPTRKTLRWQDTMNALRNAMVDMDNEGNSDFYMDIDPDFHDRLSAFVDTNNKYESIYSMNSTQLQEVDYLVSVTKKAVTEANKLHANKRYSSIVELGNSTISDLDKKKKKAMQSEVVRKIDNFLSYDQMDSFSFADTLGDAGKSVIQSLRDGQDRHTVNVKQAVDFMENLTDGIKIKNWTGRNALVNTFDINGQEVKMTVGQIMELYLLNKREQARGHIYGGGIKVLDVIGKEDGKKVKLKYEQPINLSQFDVETIISSLTDEQIKVADGMQKFLGEDVAKWGNETTVEMYGYKKFTEKNYYPIKSDDNYTATSDKNNSTNGQMYAIKNLGMTKGTAKNANNPIYIGDVFDTFSSHVNEMSTYNAFMIPISDAMKWYNYKNVITGLDGKKIFNSVKSSLERTGGKASKDYFVNLIKDINGVSKMAQSTEWYKGITSNFKVAAVGGNLRVAIQQPTAYFRAYALIDSKYLAMGPSKLPPVKRMQKYAPIAQWKNWGFFETNVGRSMKSIIVDEYSMTESVREKSLWLAGKADDITWGFLWNAVEFETKAKHKNLQVGSEEFYQEVGKRFTEVVDRTQVVDTVFHRSQMMRSKDGYLKMITSFMSEPNKSFNMLRNALMNYTNKPTSEHIKLIYRATMAWGVSSIATSMASAVMDALRSREKEREFKEKWGDAAWANFWDNINPANLLPFTRDIMSLMGKYNPSRIDMTAISNLRLSGEEIYKLYNGESKKSPYAVTSQTIKAASQFLGIPAGNILREVEGVINTILKDGIEWENETANAKKAYGNIYNSLMSGKKEDYERIYKKMYNKYTDEAKGKGKPYDKDTISKKIEDNIRDILIEDENVIRVANDRINGISYTTSNLVLEYEIKGFSKDTVISAINATYEKIKKEKKKAENPTETKKEKPLSSYSYSDLHAAIETGNDKSIEEIRDHLLEKEWEFKNIKSSVTGKMKPVYIEYYEQGNTKAMNELGNRLIKYFGYEQDDLDDWIPGRGYKDLGQAIIDGDSKKLVEIREYYLENGKNISSIRSGVTRYIKPLYLEYYQKGNTRKMEQLKTDLIDYFGYNSNTIDKWIK